MAMIDDSTGNAPIRQAAVAGMFYPNAPRVLSRDIEQLFLQVAENSVPDAKALIVPHAGYIYSGAIAAAAYALWQNERDVIRRIVLLGPSHYMALNGLALPGCEAFETPLGIVPVDLAAVIALRDMPQVMSSRAAHAQEHALEVQLPFLQKTLSNFSIVPLLAGHTTPQAVAEVIQCLWGGDETRFVISSDLSHYLSDNKARQMDAETVARIMALDPSLEMSHACGALLINGFLLAAKKNQLHPKLIDQCNSGRVSGDRQRVVGYAAFVFGRS